MMGYDRRGNIMAVDRAIERELAYRKKVEMLGLEPYGDSGWKDFLPLQKPSSSVISRPPRPSSSLVPSVSGKKQEAPSSSSLEHIVPHPILIPTPDTNPKPWPRSSLSPSVAAMKQKAPISSLKSRADNLFCEVCLVSCSGPQNFKMHKRGRQHSANVKKLKGMGPKDNKSLWCEFCKISCIDETSLRLHLSGQKHMAKLQKLEVGGKDGGEEVNQRQWCGLCKIWCMNEYAFKQHLEGKKHMTKLHTVKEKKGAAEEEAALEMLGWNDLESELIWY